MKTLLLMRHAKSSWKEADRVDHDRPLGKRGKRDAPRMGQLLRKQGIYPDLILSSTARRARKTAEKLVQAGGFDTVIEIRNELYHADPQTCVDVLHDVYYDDPCVLLVGHNPCLEEFFEALTGSYERLPTAAVARIRLPLSTWNSLTLQSAGELDGIWRPRDHL